MNNKERKGQTGKCRINNLNWHHDKKLKENKKLIILSPNNPRLLQSKTEKDRKLIILLRVFCLILLIVEGWAVGKMRYMFV